MSSGADLVAEARTCLGKPYVFGAAGPNAFDCSGLVQYCLEEIGMTNVPRTSEEQWAWVTQVSQPTTGTLIFFTGAPEEAGNPGHVGIVVAPGVMIDAPHTGAVVEQVNYQTNGTGDNMLWGYGNVPSLTQSNTANPASNPPQVKDSLYGGISGFVVIVIFVLLLLLLAVVMFAALAGGAMFT